MLFNPSTLKVDVKAHWIAGMALIDCPLSYRASMVLKDRYDNPISLYEDTGSEDQVLVPINMIPRYHKDYRVNPRISYSVSKKFPARNSTQKRLVQESSDLLLSGVNHVLRASTGFGKTWCGLQIAAKLGLKTLIVVTKEDLLEQWERDAKKFLGLKDDQIGIIQQKKCQYGRDFVIGMVHSLAESGKYPLAMREAFGLVIFDEVHRMAAPTFSTVAGLFYARYRLGLTATPTRSDGAEFLVEAHIGKVQVTGDLIKERPKVIPLVTNWKPSKRVWYTPGKLGALISNMAKDHERNARVVKWAVMAYNKGRNIVVMSDLAVDKHLGLLRSMLIDDGIPDQDIGYYVGGMKESERLEAKNKRVVLATYAMCAEATDVPQWDTLIMATPRANIVQSVGRILRECAGKKQPVVVDFIDGKVDILRGYYLARCKQYRSPSLGAEIKQG